MSVISYHISPRRRLVLLSVAGFFIALPSLLLLAWIFSADQSLAFAAAIVACIMLPFFIFMCFCAFYPRLDVTPDGLHLRGVIGFARIFVAWTSIERLRLEPGSEALVLRDPLTTRSARSWGNWSGVRYSGAPLYDREQQELIKAARYVPLQAFAWWFEHGDLLALMRTHAPALFENFDQVMQTAKQRSAASRKIVLGVSVFTAICIGLAVYLGIYYPDLFDHPTVGSLASKISIVLGYVIALVLSWCAIVNLIASFQFARSRKYGMTAFWLIAAVVQFLLAILSLAKSSGA